MSPRGNNRSEGGALRDSASTQAERQSKHQRGVSPLKAKPKTHPAEFVVELSLIILGCWLIFRPGQSILEESPTQRFRLKQSIGGKVISDVTVSNLTSVVYVTFWTNWNLTVTQSNHLTNWRSYRYLKNKGLTSGGFLLY